MRAAAIARIRRYLGGSRRAVSVAWTQCLCCTALHGSVGGALQSPLGEDAGNVGTLLFVNGDELDEVRRWASEDPYNQAGLFESVLVAPVTQYALSAAGGKLAEL